MTMNTYVVSDCNGATFKRLSAFLTRGKAKAMRVVYDAESGTLDLLTSTADTCFTPKDDGVTHARIPVGAAHTAAAGVSAIADFTARDAAKAFKMADAKATYAAVLTIDDDTHAATFALRVVGDVTDVAVVGTCPKADDTPNNSYAADALAWAARLNTSRDGKAFAPVGTYTFDGKAFAAALKQVALSASVDDNWRPLLSGVHMAFDDGGVRVEATDRFRVSRLTVAATDATSDSHEDRDVVVSAPELCGIVQAFADGKSSTVTVEVYHSMLRVRGAAFAGVDVILQTMDGKYPAVQSLYGRADVTCVGSIKAADVVAAVKRVCPNWNRKRNVTPVHVSGNGNVVIVWDPETLMHVRFNVPCGEFNFAFNPRFLIDALTQTADADGCVSISGVKREAKDVVPSHVKPVQFCGADGAAGIETLVVPMRDAQGDCVPCPFFASATPAAGNDAADVAEPSAPKTDAADAADVAETASADMADVAETATADAADTADTTDDIAQVETVVVEPVEVEHDGVVDVELAETSETIPVVEAETAETETAEADSLSNDDLIKAIAPTFDATHGRVTTKPCTGKWRGNSDVRIVFDNGRVLYIGVAATRKAKTKTMQREFLKEACALLSPDAVEARKRRAMRALRELESKDAEIARAHGVEPYRVLAVELGQVESVLTCPYYVVLAIGDRIVTNGSLDEFSRFVEHDKWDRLATPASSFRVSRYSNKTSIDYVFHGIGFDADSYAVVSVPDEVLANARKVLADREPRAVESEPQLPAECSAVTQEIPEVPPQVNDQARVLKVSEHVIPTGQKVAGGEMFPDVSYRSVHAFTVPVLDAAGNVVKRKKVAYAFRHNGMVHVVRRDRYEQAGRNATVEAAIAEFVAKLQKAA